MGREHKVRQDVPGFTGKRLLGSLGAMGAQGLDLHAGQGDAPPALGRLRLLEVQLTEGGLERLVHGGRAGVEIDVTPAHAEQFTAPHAGAEGQQQRHVQARAFGGARHGGRALRARCAGTRRPQRP
jgi:hypothetical protein